MLLERRYDEVPAAFEQMRQMAPHTSSADLGIGQVYLGAAYAAKGDRPKTLETMRKAFQAGFSDFAALDNSPYFDSLRQDAQFQRRLRDRM